MMDVDRASLEKTTDEVREVGGRDAAIPLVGDVTNPNDAEHVVRATIDGLGGLHILLNNAGINPRNEPDEHGLLFAAIPVEDWTRTFAVNVNGPFFMARAAVGHLVEQGWGRIIGVTTGLDTMLARGPYGPTKAAHEAFIATMAKELEGSGVTANVLIPGGAANTFMTGQGDRPELLDPTVMQAPAVWLASPASDGFNGRRIIAQFWDEALPIGDRLAKASAPAAWPGLGRPPRTPAT